MAATRHFWCLFRVEFYNSLIISASQSIIRIQPRMQSVFLLSARHGMCNSLKHTELHWSRLTLLMYRSYNHDQKVPTKDFCPSVIPSVSPSVTSQTQKTLACLFWHVVTSLTSTMFWHLVTSLKSTTLIVAWRRARRCSCTSWKLSSHGGLAIDYRNLLQSVVSVVLLWWHDGGSVADVRIFSGMNGIRALCGPCGICTVQ